MRHSFLDINSFVAHRWHDRANSELHTWARSSLAVLDILAAPGETLGVIDMMYLVALTFKLIAGFQSCHVFSGHDKITSW